MKIIIKTWVLLCFFGVFSPIDAEEVLTKKETEKVQIKIEEVINSYVSNGAFEGVVLVSRSGKAIVEKAYGWADRAKDKPMALDNTFQLASLSKPITATMLLILQEQGKLTLTNSLAAYFPEFDNTLGKKITLHHLLSHTSGIPNHFVIDGWFDPDFHKQTSESDFVGVIANIPMQFEPGTDYLYSNPGYFLLGKVIEKTTGKSYSASIQKYLFAPLAMHLSGVASGHPSISTNAEEYRWNSSGGYSKEVSKNMTLFGAGASIYSSVNDLHRFDLALYGDKLLKDKNKRLMFDAKQSYSWDVGKVAISPEIKPNVHIANGQLDGYSTMMTRFIDDKHSVILLSNVGMNYAIKQQLTLDIASVLYNRSAPSRTNDATLFLIKNIVSGQFNQALTNLKSGQLSQEVSEQSLSSLAYQLLWSNLPKKALQLFSFIEDKFPNSSTAKNNRVRACQHRLTKGVKIRASICNQENK